MLSEKVLDGKVASELWPVSRKRLVGEKARVALFLTAAGILALASGIYFEGSFSHWHCGILLLLAHVPWVLCLTLWCVVVLRRKGKISRYQRRAIVISMVSAICVIVSLASGSATNRWHISSARAYVAKVVPKLDDYKKRMGYYPQSLSEADSTPPPKLLREPSSYSAERDGFLFIYSDNAGMMDDYGFRSADRKWVYFD